MRSRGKAMLSCLCVSVCLQKICFKQGHKGVYRRHSQRKTISIIILGRFCTWYKSRWFFRSLFQLLPIIGFVAPPLSKLYVVVTVSNTTRTPIRKNTGRIDLAMCGEVRRVSIPGIHSSWGLCYGERHADNYYSWIYHSSLRLGYLPSWPLHRTWI